MPTKDFHPIANVDFNVVKSVQKKQNHHRNWHACL